MTGNVLAVYFNLYLFLFIFGAVIGSFLNVVILRLPCHETFITGRSHCMTCGNELKPRDMIPILSYLLLRGKCRSCGSKISPRYMVVEGLTGLLAVAAYITYGYSWTTLAVFALFALLVVVAFIDIDTMLIPNGLNLFLLLPGVALVFLLPQVSLISHLIGAFCVSVPLLLLTLALPGSFGGGDIKLYAVCGLALGWQLTVFSFFVALLIGGGRGIYLLLTKKIGPKEHMVFGPAVAGGIVIALLFGNTILHWYFGLF